MVKYISWSIPILLALLAGCEYVRPTINAPLKQWDPIAGYRFSNLPPSQAGSTDSLFIIATFSGGGTRASTLAFGVLRELARTSITWEGHQKRLLDELNIITALSGGTFTAGYYALFGDQIFHDFEYRFLRKDWEAELKARILWSPSNWFRLWSPYFGRAHIMAELLDEALFERKTYGDLLARNRRPWLLIHATDMATLSRFEFNQFQFDLICSNLGQLPLAMASASSAALPLVLSPISFKNYAGHCGYEIPSWLETAKTGRRVPAGGTQTSQATADRIAAQRANELLSYLDVDKRPYIHLLDGGLSDNLALRGLVEAQGLYGGLEAMLKVGGVKNVRKFVIIGVSAETSPDMMEFRSDQVPVLSKAMNSLVDVPINRYSFDTLTLLGLGVEDWKKKLRESRRAADSPFAQDAEIYFINASLSEIPDAAERAALMKIPTTLYLTDEQIDRLLIAASRLIHNNPDFQRLMQDIGASR